MNQHGFILTSDSFDHNQQLNIQSWLLTPDGVKCLRWRNQQRIAFVRTADRANIEIALSEVSGWKLEDKGFRSFTLEPLLVLYSDSNRTFFSIRQKLDHSLIKVFEGDIQPADRFFMERFIRGSLQYEALEDGRCKPHDFRPRLKWVSFDIETNIPRKGQTFEIYSIGIVAGGWQSGGESAAQYPVPEIEKVWLRSAADGEHFERVSGERELLEKFIAWVAEFNPDIFVGWNPISFDLKILQDRCDYFEMPFAIGRSDVANEPYDPNHIVPYWRDPEKGRVRIPGRVILDGIDVCRNATHHFESYSLNFVSEQVLGENKLLTGDDRGDEITELFNEDPEQLAKYNLKDCRLVWDIFCKLELLDYLVERSMMTGLPIDRVGGSVAAFEYLYLPQLHRAKYAAPNLGDGFSAIKSPGGYVMDSVPGLYEHILVLDFKSLYPSIIRTFCIDPVGMIEGLILKKDSQDMIPGFQGARFSKSKHFLPGMIRDLWQQRDIAKSQSKAAMSQAIKIIMNSFYGVLGSNGCRFFDTRLASSITMRGHEIIQTTADWIEEMGYQVIYGDTDSVFVWAAAKGEKLNQNQANEIGSKLGKTLNQRWQSLIKERYGVDCFLELEYETHYKKFVMPTIRNSDQGTKKRYAGLIEKNGQDTMVFKGLETVRSDWTQLAKDFQRTLYEKVFAGEEVESFIKEWVENLRTGKLDNMLVYKKRLRQPLKAYQKNTPPHAKAAKLLNEYRRQQNLPPKFDWGGRIEYLLTTAGPEPIEFVHSPIDYDHYIEKQLQPIADGILMFIGLDFEQIVDGQIGFGF